ncbi:MAG: Ribosome-binding factor A [uncultured Campylobacterales bacterium]|uniref:Ribosome-binding factor A n=1 Tax=uncultured Campylobacterales bacterium TaxID=352960 RepID=A0A6S6SHX2_9BACT|nr:MAG: Ribosome-binding factor A [uncultured Campylobacterales bacterium]
MLKNKSVKLLKTESLLKEVISEAFGTLGDLELRGLCVTDVDCAKGKYDAKVYVDPMMFDERERVLILRKLKKAKGLLQEYCLSSEGWYRCPKLSFYFDDMLAHQNKMEKLFEKVREEFGEN